MEKLMIRGGKSLRGTVQISGAKNSAVALLPAAILAESTVVLDNLPLISDVAVYSDILRELGGTVTRSGDAISIDPSGMQSIPMPNGKVKLLRASYYLMGAMLGRFGEATIGLPGGALQQAEILDMSGRLVLTAALRGEQAEVNVAALAPGAYLVRCTDASGAVSRVRIVRQ